MAKRKQSSRRKPIGKRISDGFNSLTEAIENVSKGVFGGIGSFFSFLGNLLFPKALAKKVEKATSATSQSVGKKVGALTENVEKRFSTGASGIFTWIGFLFRILIPKPIANWFSAVSKATNQWLGARFRAFFKWLGTLAERYLPKWLVEFGKRFSERQSKRWRTASQFATAWWKSRDFNALAWSTPAFLFAVPVSVVLAVASVQSPSAKHNYYSNQMMKALEEKQFDVAAIYEKKLAQLGTRRLEDNIFRTAIKLEEDGKMQEAFRKMRSIAPLDDDLLPPLPRVTAVDASDESQTIKPHPLAYCWLAAVLLRDDHQLDDPQLRIPMIDRYTETALDKDSENVRGKYLRVRYLLAINARQEAIQLMQEIVSDYEEFNGELMYYCLESGDRSRARTRAKRYVKHMSIEHSDVLKLSRRQTRNAPSELEANPPASPKLTLNEWRLWIMAAELTQDFEQADIVARAAGREFPEDEEIQAAAKKVVLVQLRRATPNTQAEADLLREAHALDRENGEVILRFARRWADNPELFQAHVEEMLAENIISETLLLKTSEVHAVRKEYDSAVACCEMALRVNPSSSRAHNNIAWVQANVEPIDLSAALRSVNQAIEAEPRAGYYETRGQIYYAQGDLVQATDDLERAVNGNLPAEDLVNTHETLAKIYKQRGDQEKSSAHQARASNIRMRIRS